jgi:hypothetical protein
MSNGGYAVVQQAAEHAEMREAHRARVRDTRALALRAATVSVAPNR